MAKKIGAIVSISIIAILIIATIIMANVNVNYGINCSTPTSVWVNYNSNNPNNERNAQDKADEIINFINNASKEKSLTALFNKTLGKEAEVFATSEKSLPSNSDFYIRYRYENAQKLKVGDDDYKDSTGNAVYYDDLVFTVENEEGISIVKVYVIQDSQNANKYTHYYELEADFTALYDYLVDNNFNV